jgi:hypothetical protein
VLEVVTKIWKCSIHSVLAGQAKFINLTLNFVIDSVRIKGTILFGSVIIIQLH